MLGPVDYVLWFLGAFAEIAALVCLCKSRSLWRHFTIFVYLSATFLVSAGRYVIYLQYGFSSDQYGYFYFFSDAFLNICLFFVLMELYSYVFQEMGVHKHIRVAALLLLAGTAFVSFLIVVAASKTDQLLGPFVITLSQNLYFEGLLLTYMLWIAVMKLRETRTRLIQLVAALGVYVSAFAANYALHKFAPGHAMIWAYLPTIMAIFLPASWAFTFAKVSEEARLATARVAATQTK